MNKNAILLVRVSTQQQDFNAQVFDLQDYAKEKGFTNFKIIETKETGLADLEEKIGTNELFDFVAKNPDYKTVFATEISRLGRRQSVLHTIKEWFIKNRIQLYFKDSGYTLFEKDSVSVSIGGEMMFTLYGLFAESEIKSKMERFARKRRELMELGVSISGKVLFGYERFKLDSGKNTLITNTENSEIVRTIYNWYLHGIDSANKNPSIKRITLECIKRGFHRYTHSKRNVNKLLKEEGYTGFKVSINKRKNPKYRIISSEPEYITSNNKIKYPVIIDKELFENVQRKLQSNIINADKETVHTTLLSKLINCPSCGRKWSANYRNNNNLNRNSYRCTSRTDASTCGNTKSISMALLDNSIWSLLKNDVFTIATKIVELNPNMELYDFEVQKSNLISREKEIDLEIENISYTLNNLNKFKNIDIRKFIDSQNKKFEKLDKEKGKLVQEKTKIESMQLILNQQKQDLNGIFTNNIGQIESSRELLKKYINSFVKDIDILYHDTKYTILKVKIKDYTKFNFANEYKSLETKDIYQISHLAIDKRITRDIKILHSVGYEMENSNKTNELHKEIQNKVMIRILEGNDFTNRKLIPYTKLEL